MEFLVIVCIIFWTLHSSLFAFIFASTLVYFVTTFVDLFVLGSKSSKNSWSSYNIDGGKVDMFLPSWKELMSQFTLV
jgi:hypothetical protein